MPRKKLTEIIIPVKLKRNQVFLFDVLKSATITLQNKYFEKTYVRYNKEYRWHTSDLRHTLWETRKSLIEDLIDDGYILYVEK